MRTRMTYGLGIRINNSYEGKPLEWELKKMMTEKVPIQATSPEIFTEREKGVMPQYDIRTDRWEIAERSMEIVEQARTAITEKDKEPNETQEPIAGNESTEKAA